MTSRTSMLASSVLLLLGVTAVTLGGVVLETRQTLLTSDGLAATVGAALADPRVSAYVADRVTEAVLAAKPDLTALKPMVAAAAQGTVSSPAFRRALQAGVRSTHAALTSEQGRNVALSIPDVGAILRSAAGRLSPEVAERIPSRVSVLMGPDGQNRVATAVVGSWRLARRMAVAAVATLLVGIGMMLGGLALARDRRRAFLNAAVYLLAAGVFLLAVLPLAGWVVQSLASDPLGQGAAAGIWAAVTAGIRAFGVTLAVVGLVLAASAQSLLERVSIAGVFDWVRALLAAPPGGAWGRLARGLIVCLAGLGAVRYPAAAVEWLVLAVGGACVFAGARELVALLVTAVGARAEAGTARALGHRWRPVAAVIAAVLVLAVVAIVATRREATVTAVARGLCNGSAALCGKPLNDVSFAGAHNAMSAADVPGWMFPQHERGVASQLADGVRAFLIDVHYGRPVEGRVKTDLDAETTSRAKLEEAVGKEGVDAAMRIRDRFAGQDTGPTGLYLCHGFCELGAQPFGPWLTTLYEFLAQHPDEVVVLVIEDYVSPQDLASEFERAGLIDLVYRGPARAPWPTLQELIDTRQRVLVMTESGRPGVPWLPGAFDVMQETPYKFKAPAEMSCAPNRGGTGASLFQINNWIDTTPTPKPSNAALVNAYDALLARARRCQAERGLRPTIVAVDFYRTGDVVRVVRTLNGEGP
jgi:hypothetical protein